MFAKHLPPSAAAPQVLWVGAAAPDWPPEMALTLTIGPEHAALGAFDAVAGVAGPETVAQWQPYLRPGGRLMLACAALAAETLLNALTVAGYIHCLVEPLPNGLTLYRGERPPEGNGVERVQRLAVQSPPTEAPSRAVFLLIQQTPNKPAWKLAPDEPVAWRAVTLLEPQAQQPVLLGFSSLVKAVAFMQAAILAHATLSRTIPGVNKVGKFPPSATTTWPHPLVLNPTFADWQTAPLGPPLSVDPRAALASEE